MADEAEKEIEVKAVVVKPGLKDKISDGMAKAKVKAKESQVILKEKYDELSALCKILEAKCKAQARIIQEKAEQSENLKKAGGIWARIKAYFAKITITPEKKLVFCRHTDSVLYGYIESRAGNTVIMREACYLDIDKTFIETSITGDGIKSKVPVYGHALISNIDLIMDVSPEAAKVIENL